MRFVLLDLTSIKIKKFAFVLLGTLVTGLFIFGLTKLTNFSGRQITYLNPVSYSKTLAAETIAKSVPKRIVGYVPFWTLNDIRPENLENLDSAFYFSLTVKGDGNFDKTDPGWARMSSLDKYPKRFGLTITCMTQEDITAVLQSPIRRGKVIQNTVSLMKEKGFTDLNVDFEYVGTPPNNLIPAYTDFLKDFRDSLNKSLPAASLSVAVLSDSISKVRLYDNKNLAQHVDYIVVMAYDFTRLGSTMAGPTAPLFGKGKYEYDVYTTVTDFLKEVPSEKIVLGIPFYGYEWPTVNNQANSFVLGTSSFGPAISTYKRTMETISANTGSANFDNESKSFWFSYFDAQSRNWRQVWFDDERTLGLKMDLVKQANLGGIAVWAVGYEGTYGEKLWKTITEKLR